MRGMVWAAAGECDNGESGESSAGPPPAPVGDFPDLPQEFSRMPLPAEARLKSRDNGECKSMSPRILDHVVFVVCPTIYEAWAAKFVTGKVFFTEGFSGRAHRDDRCPLAHISEESEKALAALQLISTQHQMALPLEGVTRADVARAKVARDQRHHLLPGVHGDFVAAAIGRRHHVGIG